jgi:hypothetical protein
VVLIGGVPVKIVARVPVFPGMSKGTPLIVVSERALSDRLRASGRPDPRRSAFTYLWAKGPPEAVQRDLARASVDVYYQTSVDELLRRASVSSVTRVYGYVRAIAVATSLFALLVLVLFLYGRETSQAVAAAMSKRMGVGTASRLGAIVVEVSAQVAVAVTVATVIGVLAAGAVIGRIDPLPDYAPAPGISVDSKSWLGAILLVLFSALIAAAVALKSDRADVRSAFRSG